MPSVPQSVFSNANLEWDGHGRPRSLTYGDIYFSGADPLGESTHVFLQGNALAERWRKLEQPHFIIGETGFGSGLNFLNSCRLWCETAPATCTLHYVACELHPLTLADMQTLHEQWPELARWRNPLLRQYPDHTAGVHQFTLQFDEHRVVLTLLYGEAQAMFAEQYQVEGWRADAWFLDGFAPRLNPALWNVSLLQQLAALSHAGTTLATYSVAGVFREALGEAGFQFVKAPGFTGKRHMLRAKLSEAPVWLPAYPARSVTVIGGGLAGCSTAYALAESGWQVVLLEREAALASQGSGNPQGILHCKPGKLNSAANQFNLLAFLHAARHYAVLAEAGHLEWQGCGMLQLAVTPALAQRFQKVVDSGLYAAQVVRLVDPAEASRLAGLLLDKTALHFPLAGWLSPPALCSSYASHPGIRVRQRDEALALDASDMGWNVQLTDAGVGEQSAVAILCNGSDLPQFSQTRHYPVLANRGQVDVYDAMKLPQANTVLCGQGYLVPGATQLSVGGSYFVGGDTTDIREQRRQAHLQQLRDLQPEVAGELARRQPILQRSSSRCILPDRLPLLGQACQPASAGSKPLPGLYLNIGHGSHGLTRTPLCAALLSALLNRTPLPVSKSVAALLAPERFRL